MKKHIFALAAALLAAAILGGAVSAGDAPDWRGLLRSYREDGDVGQLLFVRYTGNSAARATLYVKEREQDDRWRVVLDTEAEVGLNGIGKEREGDGRTPTGDFGVGTAFGIWEDPGTRLPYLAVTDTVYACDEEGEYYNRIIDTSFTGHRCRGEHMLECTPEYHYGIEVRYNDGGVYGLGSAIFVHCVGGRGYTYGCVGLPEEDMITLLRYAEPGMRIVIGDR